MPYVLRLNDMRSGKVEYGVDVCRAETVEQLQALLEKSYEPWRDGKWHKSHRKGSLLEWYNQPSVMFDHGVHRYRTRDEMRSYFEWVRTTSPFADPRTIEETLREFDDWERGVPEIS